MFTDTERKTKFGIDKLSLMIAFMPVLDIDSDSKDWKEKLNESIDELKSFLSTNIKRDLTETEHVNMLKGLKDYACSDSATNERMKAMEYLFNLEFINE